MTILAVVPVMAKESPVDLSGNITLSPVKSRANASHRQVPCYPVYIRKGGEEEVKELRVCSYFYVP